MDNFQLIDIDQIKLQKKIMNRKKTELSSINFLKLSKSIETRGLTVPIIVRANGNNSYELYVGYRRFMAHKLLRDNGNETFQFIKAIVKPVSTSDDKMLSMTILENKMRKDLSMIEAVVTQVSYLPFCFPECTSNTMIDNLNFGFTILKHWTSYVRSDFKKKDSLEDLKEITKCDNPEQYLHNFFEIVGETERTFYEKADVFINSPTDLILLMHRGKITYTRAKQLNRIPSEERKEMIINTLKNTDKMRDIDIKRMIDESNLAANPDLWERKIIKRIEIISKVLRSKSYKPLSSDNKNDIDAHIDYIHHLLFPNKDDT